MARAREHGRGERVLPGLWRLRLPLPWPGIPHCNAWAIRSGSGFVLVDTGMHDEGSLEQLETAMEQVHLSLQDVTLLVCTHAHSDHWGQAATVRDRAGCAFWMHSRPQELAGDRDLTATTRRLEVGRQSGVPEAALRALQERIEGAPSGIAREIDPDRELVEGDEIETDLGTWRVIETPGHTPSHVCLYQAERRVLISGDHLLGRISLYFDYGYTPDPVAEFLDSLQRTEELNARLALSGHGRPFLDVPGHIAANRKLIAERLELALGAVTDRRRTALEIAPAVYGEPVDIHNGAWFLSQTLNYLHHLEAQGRVQREPRADGSERWYAL